MWLLADVAKEGKNLRLNKEKFLIVMKKGKMIHSPLFSLYYLEAENMAFSAAASKKVSKKAVIRNRNKRRIREIFRKQVPEIALGEYIIFIKKDISALKHTVLKEELSAILIKAK